MSTVHQARATLDDLYRTHDKAELIGGRIVKFMATGRKPHRVAFRIAQSLDAFAEKTKVGEAYSDNIGFAVPILPSGRESFSPDASYFRGPFPENEMRFLEGAPHFAAEVRSENDYTPSAELKMAEKREDYFQAGTEVVWDVDTEAKCIYVYRASDPDHPVIFRSGEIAEAEPAVFGWRVAVDCIFGE